MLGVSSEQSFRFKEAELGRAQRCASLSSSGPRVSSSITVSVQVLQSGPQNSKFQSLLEGVTVALGRELQLHPQETIALIRSVPEGSAVPGIQSDCS